MRVTVVGQTSTSCVSRASRCLPFSEMCNAVLYRIITGVPSVSARIRSAYVVPLVRDPRPHDSSSSQSPWRNTTRWPDAPRKASATCQPVGGRSSPSTRTDMTMACGSSSSRNSSPISPFTAATTLRPKRLDSIGEPTPRAESARTEPLPTRRTPEIAP